MNVATMEHSLVALNDGRIMAVGGFNDSSSMRGADRAEIFDPDTWSPGPEMSQPRANRSKSLMPDGSVLIAGGINQDRDSKYLTASTEFIET